jgi:hypothetical protein
MFFKTLPKRLLLQHSATASCFNTHMKITKYYILHVSRQISFKLFLRNPYGSHSLPYLPHLKKWVRKYRKSKQQ